MKPSAIIRLPALPRARFQDQLHPNAQGYQIRADALLPTWDGLTK
jgi:lysophospholipase L1-like esterase